MTRSIWSRLKVPAVVLLIGLNVLYFGGNALLDLWQTLGPANHFSGTITAHDHITTEGENAQDYYLITIDTGHGMLKFDVPDHTFSDTQIGQQATGVLDARGLLGHDEALRSLTAGGQPVFRSNAINRAIGQFFILVVVCGVGGLAIKWIVWRRQRRSVVASPDLPGS